MQKRCGNRVRMNVFCLHFTMKYLSILLLYGLRFTSHSSLVTMPLRVIALWYFDQPASGCVAPTFIASQPHTTLRSMIAAAAAAAYSGQSCQGCTTGY